MRLQRVFSLAERLKVTASMEAFNLLNHVNVQNIDQVYGAADFLGPVPISSSAVLPNPTFGTPNYVSLALIRAFQFLRRDPIGRSQLPNTTP